LVETGKLDVRQLLDGQSETRAALESHETGLVVRGVLAQLSADYAAMLTAKYLDNHSLAEMAAQFGSTVDATKSKLARARQEFRAKFEFTSKWPMPRQIDRFS
jgi:DNA-directed RNA polymerase specialized sigma24 family protein